MTVTDDDRLTSSRYERARVSVVICCCREDRFPQLLASIDSVGRQALPPHEIIVAVDHNPTLEGRTRDARPEVAVVPSENETGVSGTRNAGLAAATGDIVAFVDDDATAGPDWLARLTEAYRDPAVIGVGGGVVPQWASRAPRWLPAAFYWVVGCSWDGLPDTPSPVRNLIGCNMSFLREPCVSAGGFANERAIVNDETEFCIRLTEQHPGHRLVYLPDAVVHHNVPEPRTRFRYFLGRCWREGREKRVTVGAVGSTIGLARERTHLVSIIPKAIVRGARDAIGGDPTGLARALALIAGTAATMLAFLLPNRAARRPHR